jgi:hypothetical protein
MGLFSSKTITVTGTAGTYLLEEADDQKDLLREAVLAAILADRDIVPPILEAYGSNFAGKADDFYNFGAEGDYFFGLPEGTVEQPIIDYGAVAQVIADKEGEPVTVLSTYVETHDDQMITKEFVQDNFGWDPVTNLLTGLTNSPTRDAMYRGSALDFINKVIHVHYWFGEQVYDPKPGFPSLYRDVTYSEIHSIPTLSDDVYYHSLYFVDSDPDNIEHYWTYNTTLTTHPELALDTEIVYRSPYYPIAPIRVEKHNTNDDLIDGEPSKMQKDVRKILKHLDMDLDSITKDVEKNPDIGSVDSVFTTFAVNIQTDSQISLRYLYDFFAEQINFATVSQYKYERSLPERYGRPGTPHVYNIIAIIDGEFHTEIMFNYLTFSKKQGKAAPDIKVGEYASETILKDAWLLRYGFYTDKKFYSVQHEFMIRKQVSENEYEEYFVHGLNHVTLGIYKNSITHKSLKDSLDGGDVNNPKERGFFIPLSRKIVTSYTEQEQIEIHRNSLFMAVYAEQRQKIKWYEREWFGKLLEIASVVFVISAFATGGWTAVLERIITAYAIQAAAEGLIDLVGGELAIFAAAIAIVAAIYYAREGGELNNIYAETYLKAATITIDVSTQYFMDEALEEMEETKKFLEDTAEQKEELQKELDVLNNNDNMLADPLLVVRKNEGYFDPNEGVDAFFYRTVGNQNPGVASLDYADNYVDYMLDLPKANKPEFNN